jgi:transposase
LIETEKMPIRKVLKEVGVSVGSWYDKREKKTDKVKRGPKPKVPDEIVLAEAKEYLKEPIFFNEGYKKLKIRLEEERGIKVGKERLRKILNVANLLLGQRNRQRVSPYQHTGIIKRQSQIKCGEQTSKSFILVLVRCFYLAL